MISWMVACGGVESHGRGLFDLRTRLSESAAAFATRGTVCRKKMQLNNVSKRTELQRDSAGWMSEWRHLLYFDLGQQQHRSLYLSNTEQNDELKVVRYLPISSDNGAEVEELIVISDTKDRLLSLSGKYRSKQHLYGQYAELRIEFSRGEHPALMRSCTIKGYQKVFAEDTIPYQVTWTYE